MPAIVMINNSEENYLRNNLAHIIKKFKNQGHYLLITRYTENV
jgi:uncharacterized protein YcgL (UPF0745 family)